MKRILQDYMSRCPALVLICIEGFSVYTATGIIKIAFTQIQPLYAAWFRVGFLTIILCLWRRPWREEKRALLPKRWQDWGMLALLGTSIMLMNTMFYVAISAMDIGIAVSIEFIGPLLVAVITGRNWRERVGIVLAAFAVTLLAGVSYHEGNPHIVLGITAIIIGGLMWGVFIIVGRKIAFGNHTNDMLAYGLLIGFALQSTVLAVPSVRAIIHPQPSATWAATPHGKWLLVGLLIVVALFGSAIPLLFDMQIMRKVTSGSYSILQSMMPVTAVIVGLFIGEIPSILEIIGVGLVICALLITFSGDHVS